MNRSEEYTSQMVFGPGTTLAVIQKQVSRVVSKVMSERVVSSVHG